MAAKVAPRIEQTKTMSVDTGSYSTKYVSDDKNGSFLSLAASVSTNDAMVGFNTLTDSDTYDIEILEPKIAAGRWIIGKQAQGRDGVMRYSRNIQRFSSKLYKVLMCGALMASFVSKRRPLAELEKARVVDGRWRVPVRLTASIAPAYYANAPEIIDAAKGYYDFIDKRTNTLYCFTIEHVTVVPEGFGMYAQNLYHLEGKSVVKRAPKGFLDKQIAIIDGGGRTTDGTTWRGGRLIESRFDSEDVGIVITASNIVQEVLNAHSKHFKSKVDPLDIIDAMVKALPKRPGAEGGVVTLIGAGGVEVDITPISNRHMNLYADATARLYENALDSGSGISALQLGGGSMVVLKPFLSGKVSHTNTIMIGKSIKEMYMANAMGAYLWSLSQLEKLLEDQNA